MKTTKEIKNKLDECNQELKRINLMAEKDPNIMKKPFTFKDGSTYNEILFEEVLTKYVSEKRTLRWVLNYNS